MDAVYSGIGGLAHRRRFAVAPAVTVPITVSAPLPELRAIESSYATETVRPPRFSTFEELGITAPLSCPTITAGAPSTAPLEKPRFATFEELGMKTALSCPAITAATSTAALGKARFVTFEEFAMKTDVSTPTTVAATSTASLGKARFATFEELGMKPSLHSPASIAATSTAAIGTSRFVTFQELGISSDQYGCRDKNPETCPLLIAKRKAAKDAAICPLMKRPVMIQDGPVCPLVKRPVLMNDGPVCPLVKRPVLMNDGPTCPLPNRSMSVNQHWTAKQQSEADKRQAEYLEIINARDDKMSDSDATGSDMSSVDASDSDASDEEDRDDESSSSSAGNMPTKSVRGKSVGDVKGVAPTTTAAAAAAAVAVVVEPTVRTKETAKRSLVSPVSRTTTTTTTTDTMPKDASARLLVGRASNSAGSMSKDVSKSSPVVPASASSDAIPADTSKALFNMKSGEFIDARTLSLAPPALITGEAYAISIKGIKRAVRGMVGKASKGGPMLIAFNPADVLGRDGLSDEQVAMFKAIESSKVLDGGRLEVFSNKDTYSAIMPVGSKQDLGFRYAKKKLLATTVSRTPFKYSVGGDSSIAGIKVVHFGGLTNVARKRDLLVASKRKEGKGKSSTVLKGAPVTIEFRNGLTGKKASVTLDNGLEVAEDSNTTNSRLWYAKLTGKIDETTGPSYVIMRFGDTHLDARLTDVVFLYLKSVSLDFKGTYVTLLGSEHILAAQFSALVDEMVVSGFNASHTNAPMDGNDTDIASADMDTFKKVLTSLQSLIGCPGESDLSIAQHAALNTYMGALSACVHGHMMEMHGEVKEESPVCMVSEVDTLSVQSDEICDASSDMAHTLGELAGDMVDLGLDSHSIAIRAGHLYMTMFESLTCGKEIAGHLGDESTFSMCDTDMSEVAEQDVGHLALISFAHVLGNIANKSGCADAMNDLWIGASQARYADYESLLGAHFG
jgi:hypothetical protein